MKGLAATLVVTVRLLHLQWPLITKVIETPDNRVPLGFGLVRINMYYVLSTSYKIQSKFSLILG